MPKAPNTAPGPLTVAVGEILRVERARRNFNDSTLAKAANVDRTAVGLILKGKKVADIEVLERLALALGLTLTSLFKAAEDATNGLRFEA
jgi:transcriptional regulator with XRE-family HTH domain